MTTAGGFGASGGESNDVNRFHDFDDTDITILSHHHTLGIGTGQASPGDHIHDGITSKLLAGGGGGPSPATTVESETTFGVAAAVGTDLEYARQDHTHGSPTLTPANAVVAETAFGQASAVGVITTEFAREDHTHGTPAAPTIPAASGTVTDERPFGIAPAAGGAATFSRGDHTHGSPALPILTKDAACSATHTLTLASADIAGLTTTITTTKATAQIVVNCSLDFNCTTTIGAGGLLLGTLFINGVAQAGQIVGQGVTVQRLGHHCNTWARIVGITAGQVVKMQGNKSINAGVATVVQVTSRMTVSVFDV